MFDQTVKHVLTSYDTLLVRADKILRAGRIGFTSVDSVRYINSGLVEIGYTTKFRGESYADFEHVPLAMFEDDADLVSAWERVRKSKVSPC